MKRYNWFRKFFFSVPLSILTLFALGCEQTPSPSALSPAQPNVAQPQALAKKPIKIGRRIKRKYQNCSSRYVAKVMDDKGGYLALCDYEMAVPRGALTQAREMSIRIIENDGNYYEVDFKPHLADFGADGTFKRPVKIAIQFSHADLAGIDPASLTMVWYDEASGEWIEVNSEVDLRGSKIVASVWHFTQYSIATR